MSPLKINILLHYYCHPFDWPERKKDMSFMDELINADYLACKSSKEPVLVLTEKAKVFIEALLNIPEPVKVWIINPTPLYSDN